MIKRTSFIANLLIILPIFLLLSFGILVIYSSDAKLATQQAIFALLGLLLFWLFSQIDFELFDKLSRYLYFVVLIMLIIVFVVGIESRGSTRWISLAGLRFQPSEFAKPVLILFLANFWTTHLPTWKNIMKSLFWVLPLFGLIFKQPDLGTGLTILAIWIVMLIAANVSWIKLTVMSVLSAASIPIVWHFLKDYQKNRIFSFLSPESDPLGVGYNVIQAMIAVGSGEFLGRGLGRGTQSRLQFLPEFRTDFIFASIAEEFGFIGSLIVLLLYGILIYGCLRIINSSGSRFGGLLVCGVLGILFFQVAINIGMNIGILPITGITLPLLSYGGSSVVSILICLSLVVSVARHSRKNLRDFSDSD